MFVPVDNYMATGVFLLLGTNLGDKKANLSKASVFISQLGDIIRSSSIYRTSAWGKTDQPDFYNQVVEIETTLAPHDLLNQILLIEKTMGRKRIEKWGERLIDIDLLLYNDEIIDAADLKVPHPQMVNRRFTLFPLAEIAGAFIHPVVKKNINALLEECSDTLAVVKV
jgi:2-amino-4-hydroxy-6-hydroxymethyldihydropteridine diphosphokinase